MPRSAQADVPSSPPTKQIDNDMSSSPDPLALSPPSAATRQSRQLSSPRRTRQPSVPLPLTSTDANPRPTSRSSTSYSLAPNSPSRAVTEQTLSPWKIRVTVEAEPEEGPDGDGAQMQTRTYTIPLRGSDSSSPVPSNARARRSARGRTRSEEEEAATEATTSPRKRMPKPRRSATPVRGTLSTRRPRKSLTDLDITVLGDEEDEYEWSPAKSRKPKSPKPSPIKTKTQRQVGYQGNSQTSNSAENERDSIDSGLQQDEHHSSSPIRSLDLDHIEFRRSRLNEDNITPSLQDYFQKTRQGMRNVSDVPAQSYPTPSPTPSDDVEVEIESSIERDEQVEDIPEPASPGAGSASGEPAERSVEYDTIMESEGFTMIDLGTVSSARALMSSPLEPVQGSVSAAASSMSRGNQQQKAPLPIPAHVQQGEDDTELSSNIAPSPMPSTGAPQIAISGSHVDEVTSEPVMADPTASNDLLQPTSRPNLGARKITPAPYTSPTLPSPPKARPSARSRNATPEDTPEGVMDAGRALLGALSTDQRDSDFLTKGYSSATKREMRAGLRFGEELAKMTTPSSESRTGTPIKAIETSTEIQEGRTARLERQWAAERAEVIRATQTATPSRLVVIGSSDLEDELQDDVPEQQIERQFNAAPHAGASNSAGSASHSVDDSQLVEDTSIEDDIWLAEAENSSSPPQSLASRRFIFDASSSSRPQVKTGPHQPETVQPGSHIHRRPKIPSPWKRGEQTGSSAEPGQNTVLSTAETDMSLSGMLWQQPTPSQQNGTRFGANELARQAKRVSDGKRTGSSASSGGFDVQRMLSSPVKVANTARGRRNLRLKALDEDSSSSALESTSVASEDSNIGSAESILADALGDSGFEDVTTATDEPMASSPPGSRAAQFRGEFSDDSIGDVGDEESIVTPRAVTSSVGANDPVHRPPTPRSALKGGRQTVGALATVSGDGELSPSKRVVFHERSRYLNDAGEESTMSANLDSPPALPPVPLTQAPVEEAPAAKEPEQGWMGWLLRGKSEGRTVEPQVPEVDYPTPESSVVDSSSSVYEESHRDAEGYYEPRWQTTKTMLSAQGVREYFLDDFQAKQPVQLPTPDPSVDSSQTTAKSHLDTGSTTRGSKAASTGTKVSAPQIKRYPSSDPSSNPSSNPSSRSSRPVRGPKPPSYLLPPSYPSLPPGDKLRTPSAYPLSTSGTFSNAHFRTLHILHAKSLDTRLGKNTWHAPKSIRPEVEALHGLQFEADETRNGLDVFTWTVGIEECLVLERFMREVEWSWILAWYGGAAGKKDDGIAGGHEEVRRCVELVRRKAAAEDWARDLKASGDAEEMYLRQMSKVGWGWSVEDLAKWYFRVVVGEIVREEERAARESATTLVAVENRNVGGTSKRKKGKGD
jgi:hypothetical protein